MSFTFNVWLSVIQLKQFLQCSLAVWKLVVGVLFLPTGNSTLPGETGGCAAVWKAPWAWGTSKSNDCWGQEHGISTGGKREITKAGKNIKWYHLKDSLSQSVY